MLRGGGYRGVEVEGLEGVGIGFGGWVVEAWLIVPGLRP